MLRHKTLSIYCNTIIRKFAKHNDNKFKKGADAKA